MGIEIHLEVGGVMIGYAKNYVGADHRSLFQEDDRTTLISESEKEPDDESHAIRPGNEALSRTLARILPRLELMGWTINAARDEYNALVTKQSEFHEELDTPDVMTFDEFCAFANRYPLADLNDTYIEHSYERDSIVKRRFRADIAAIDRLPTPYDGSSFWSEKSGVP